MASYSAHAWKFKTNDIPLLLRNGAVALVEAPSAAKTPGDLNQALIELGSTVCKPAEPSCRACPIRPWCGAYALSQSHVSTARVPLDGTQPKPTGGDTDVPDIEEMPPSCALCAPLPISVNGTIRPTIFPMRAEKKKAREETDAVYVVEWRGHHASQGSSNRWFTLVKRPPGGELMAYQTLQMAENSNIHPSTQAFWPD
jgi:A/G-specific adenine glycosylase